MEDWWAGHKIRTGFMEEEDETAVWLSVLCRGGVMRVMVTGGSMGWMTCCRIWRDKRGKQLRADRWMAWSTNDHGR